MPQPSHTSSHIYRLKRLDLLSTIWNYSRHSRMMPCSSWIIIWIFPRFLMGNIRCSCCGWTVGKLKLINFSVSHDYFFFEIYHLTKINPNFFQGFTCIIVCSTLVVISYIQLKNFFGCSFPKEGALNETTRIYCLLL